MRHYEIVFLTHPNQADQVPEMVARYRSMIESVQGTVHRFENWGMRKLAYPVKQVYKANYVLMNVECDAKVLAEITNLFRFNDAVIRYLIIRRDKAITELSAIMQSDQEDEGKVEREVYASEKTVPRKKTRNPNQAEGAPVSTTEPKEQPEVNVNEE